MVAIKRHKVLLDQVAAGNGDWFRLDVRYDHNTDRILQIDLTVGDTIAIEGVTVDVRGGNPAVVTAAIKATDITLIEELTADGVLNLLQGPWTYIRATKTGTTGNAKIQGFI